MLNSLVPATIDAKVDNGFVTLTGTADWQYQRDEAEFVASNIAGVLDVFDEITLKAKPKAGDVKDSDQGGVQAQRQARRRRSLGHDLERDGHDRGDRELVGRARRGARGRLGGSRE